MHRIQCDLLRIITSAIPHFPYPLRFLITTRPESISPVCSNMTSARWPNMIFVDADNDIRNFLNAEFAKMRRTHPALSHHLPSHWPHPADIIQLSSSHLIYASTVIRFIQSPNIGLTIDFNLKLFKQPYREERPYAPDE